MTDLHTWILSRCAVRLYNASELYWSAISAGLSVVKPEGGMTISHDEIERTCYACAIRGELKIASIGLRDMFRTAA